MGSLRTSKEIGRKGGTLDHQSRVTNQGLAEMNEPQLRERPPAESAHGRHNGMRWWVFPAVLVIVEGRRAKMEAIPNEKPPR